MTTIDRHRKFVLAAALALTPAAASAQADCTAFLTGRWAMKGLFDMGLRKVPVDHRFTLNRDASFRTEQRFQGEDGKWQSQVVSGTWSTRSTGAGQCEILMESKHQGGSSSSTSTVTMVDRDTYRSFGMDAKRVR